MVDKQSQFERNLEKELVRAIRGRRRTQARRQKLIAIGLALATAGFVSFAGIGLLQRHETRFGSTFKGPGQPSRPQDAYPAEWEVGSLDQATAQASFPLLIPHAKDASQDNLVAIFVFPGKDAVALEFPQPASQAASSIPPVRQLYIEVWESPWLQGDPAEALKQDVAANPDAGKSFCQIEQNPAECSTARSKSGQFANNPAFVRAVVDGVEIHAYGGDDLQALIDIVSSLEKSSS